MLTTGHPPFLHPVAVGGGRGVWGCGGRAGGGGGGGARAGPAAGRVSLCGGPAQATGWLVPVRGGGACRAVSGGLRSGAALVGVRLDVGPLPPRFSLPAVAGCRMGGFPAGRGRWGGERVVGGVLARISVGAWGLCGRLCLVLVCRGGYGLGGRVLLFILGSSLGGVGPVRGLRGGGRGGWCEEWARSG